MSAHGERLIHVLLCEELGSEKIPDVTARVLKRALQTRRRSWRRLAAVAALLVGCLLAGWWITGRHYPAPEASGSYKLLGATAVRRGAVLVTESQPAALALGGYCHVRLEPHTTLRIEGEKGTEEVRLEKGALQCEVKPGVGAFAVRNRVATVSVVGTAFSVKLWERKAAGGSSRKTDWTLAVAVTSGTVSVNHNGSLSRLSPGTQHAFAESAGTGPNPPTPSYGPKRVTISGIAKALGNVSGKPDPNTAAATVTVAAEGNQVYYVLGWAGVMVAKQADGKKVEIAGVVGQRHGAKTITATSVGIKIIVVEEKPPACADKTPLIGILTAAASSAEEAASVKVGQVLYKIAKDENGRTVAREANGKKIEIKGIVEDRHGARWITVTSGKIVE